MLEEDREQGGRKGLRWQNIKSDMESNPDWTCRKRAGNKEERGIWRRFASSWVESREPAGRLSFFMDQGPGSASWSTWEAKATLNLQVRKGVLLRLDLASFHALIYSQIFTECLRLSGTVLWTGEKNPFRQGGLLYSSERDRKVKKWSEYREEHCSEQMHRARETHN